MIGRGNMGAIYVAMHEGLGQRVALKCLLPRLAIVPAHRERFLREAALTASIRHPNVVQVFDVVEHHGLPLIVMELLEGESFERVLESELPVPDKLKLLLDAMRGVAAAHAKRIVHRDIKPGNIYVISTPAGGRVAKVIDFGISKCIDEQAELSPITLAGETMGTPQYMSLEQLRGDTDIDTRTDIYSFGVVLYQLLTRKVPFDEGSLDSLALAVTRGAALPPTQLGDSLPGALEAVASKALSCAKEDRFVDLDAFITELSRATQLAASVPEFPEGAELDATARLPRSALWRERAAVGYVLVALMSIGVLEWVVHASRPAVAAPFQQQAMPMPIVAEPSRAEKDLASSSFEAEPIFALSEPPPPEPTPTPARRRITKVSRALREVAEPASRSNVAQGKRSGTLRREALLDF